MRNPFKTLAAAVQSAVASVLPTERRNWLGPRFEPMNLSATATVQAIQTALRQAENGEPTQLFQFYRDSLLNDDHIQGELNKRKLAVLAQPLSVQPRDKKNADDVKAAIAVEQMVRDCANWNDGLSALLDSVLWPVAVTEHIFKPAENKPGDVAMQFSLARFEPVNPMLFCYQWAYLTGGIGMGTASAVQLAQLNPKSEIIRNPNGGTANPYTIDLERWEPWLKLWPIDGSGRIIKDASRAEYLDAGRHMSHRGHLLTSHKDNWGGPFRSILGWWLLRGLGRDWFGRFMERYGSPFPVGRTNVQDREAVAFLEQAFSLATKIGGLVIGQDDAVELKEAMVSGGADGHERFHDCCNRAISRLIIGQDISSSAKATGLGSGVADMQEEVREDIRMFDQQRLAETLEKQLIEKFLRINGFTGSCPRLIWGGLSDDDASKLATLLKDLSVAGIEPDDEGMETVQQRLGFRVRRRAAPAPGDPSNAPTGKVIPMTAFHEHGKLIMFSAGGKELQDDPIDPIVEKRREALAAAYRGVMAPFREALLQSNSREEAMGKVTKLYRDWDPRRLTHEIEVALQICAAAGAGEKKNHRAHGAH